MTSQNAGADAAELIQVEVGSINAIQVRMLEAHVEAMEKQSKALKDEIDMIRGEMVKLNKRQIHDKVQTIIKMSAVSEVVAGMEKKAVGKGMDTFYKES